jgi:hypothetical protein
LSDLRRLLSLPVSYYKDVKKVMEIRFWLSAGQWTLLANGKSSPNVPQAKFVPKVNVSTAPRILSAMKIQALVMNLLAYVKKEPKTLARVSTIRASMSLRLTVKLIPMVMCATMVTSKNVTPISDVLILTLVALTMAPASPATSPNPELQISSAPTLLMVKFALTAIYASNVVWTILATTNLLLMLLLPFLASSVLGTAAFVAMKANVKVAALSGSALKALFALKVLVNSPAKI